MSTPSPADAERLALPGGEALVAWRRSPRARRISLRIDPQQGSVVVTLPRRAARAAGMALLIDHADWVVGRLAALPTATVLAEDALVPLNGVPHRVRRVGGAGGAWVENGEILVAGEAAFLARRVRDLLRQQARRQLTQRALQAAALAGLRPSRIVVKDTRTRWGSCTHAGVLMFSWRLVMAPAHVQDYVAAHEVAHLRHMNHAAQFWALVEALSPHRRSACAWLRDEGTRLLRVG